MFLCVRNLLEPIRELDGFVVTFYEHIGFWNHDTNWPFHLNNEALNEQKEFDHVLNKQMKQANAVEI